ncbi:MAG: Hsp20/alpha crystallin family protein [Eggerthellaceae bacterium]
MMSLVPRTYLHNTPADLYNLLDDFFTTPTSEAVRGGFKIDVKETDNEYTVEADMPGVDKNDIDIEHNNDTLTISVNYQNDDEQKDDQGEYLYRERSRVSMSRSILLKDGDEDAIQAKLENGVLKVTVPKKQHDNGARKISID